ncbi:hypothetical protein [Paenibacillus sp. 1_12]|uniref:hypothetical protein n=1 Tax=Paenibacillus sp. 1_12 TaxID=1566278 RepID=UPI001160CA1E|nr:hypothetical protein [Paenibacillus sp. 1_12]
MLRVTYTSPLVVHWATEFLAWLYFDMDGYDSNEHSDKLENIAKAAVREYMNDGEFSIGLITPHIVFNYLDYLLWQKTKQDFQFEFRNSVEHWYPQHPIDSNVKWDEQDLNHFGNLCLVSMDIDKLVLGLCAPTYLHY